MGLFVFFEVPHEVHAIAELRGSGAGTWKNAFSRRDSSSPIRNKHCFPWEHDILSCPNPILSTEHMPFLIRGSQRTPKSHITLPPEGPCPYELRRIDGVWIDTVEREILSARRMTNVASVISALMNANCRPYLPLDDIPRKSPVVARCPYRPVLSERVKIGFNILKFSASDSWKKGHGGLQTETRILISQNLCFN